MLSAEFGGERRGAVADELPRLVVNFAYTRAQAASPSLVVLTGAAPHAGSQTQHAVVEDNDIRIRRGQQIVSRRRQNSDSS